MIVTEATKFGGGLAAETAKSFHGISPNREVIILNIDYCLIRYRSLI